MFDADTDAFDCLIGALINQPVKRCTAQGSQQCQQYAKSQQHTIPGSQENDGANSQDSPGQMRPGAATGAGARAAIALAVPSLQPLKDDPLAQIEIGDCQRHIPAAGCLEHIPAQIVAGGDVIVSVKV